MAAGLQEISTPDFSIHSFNPGHFIPVFSTMKSSTPDPPMRLKSLCLKSLELKCPDSSILKSLINWQGRGPFVNYVSIQGYLVVGQQNANFSKQTLFSKHANLGYKNWQKYAYVIYEWPLGQFNIFQEIFHSTCCFHVKKVHHLRCKK